jgi:site-specific recombinase XerD
MNSQNNDLVTQYLNYLDKVRQNDPKSVDLHRVHLRRLLIWAGDESLEAVHKITPIFPAYLATTKGDHTKKPLSPRFITDTCVTARMFFTWAKREDPERFRAISNDWIEMIHPGTSSMITSQLNEHELYTLEEVRQLMAVPAHSMTEKRDRAAVAMLYLSGMRISAMLTLPISCVDLTKHKISQLPSKGVMTKFHKAAITSLLNIPDLLEIVKEWDGIVRKNIPEDGYWYALIGQQRAGPGVLRTDSGEGKPIYRRRNLARYLKQLCEQVGIPYRSPHKLRHGHAVYGVKRARNIEELKAVSQNLMHSSISITDGLYGRLTSDDVNRAITNLGAPPAQPAQPAGDMGALLQVLAKLQANPALIQTILEAPG